MLVLKSQLFIIFFILIFSPILVSSQIEEIKINPSPDKKKILEEKKTKPLQQLYKLQDNLIHSGDLIDVDILGSSEYDFRGQVSPEGFITGLKFIDNVFAQCKTEKEISKEIEKLFSKFLRKPIVVVKILDKTNRPQITLLGEIKIAQRFQLKRKVRLNELLILSGGFTEGADGEIQILRQPKINCFEKRKNLDSKIRGYDQNKKKFIKVNQNTGLEIINLKISDLLTGVKEANPEIFYGDIITVKGTDPLYVIGGVNKPGKISFRKQMTVTRAIATAGGLSTEKNTGEISIFRREGNNTRTIRVNLNEIKTGKAEDLDVRPFDVIDVAGKDTKRKFSPVVEDTNSNSEINSNLPLRVID